MQEQPSRGIPGQATLASAMGRIDLGAVPQYYRQGHPWSPIVSLIVLSELQVFSSLS